MYYPYIPLRSSVEQGERSRTGGEESGTAEQGGAELEGGGG
jgi:hypothetical protein